MMAMHMEVEARKESSSHPRGCRNGDDLAFVSDVSLVDCQQLCIEQRFVEYSYSLGECVLVFNLFKTVTKASEAECEASARSVTNVNCDTIQFTPSEEGGRGVCNLKYGRSGSLEVCVDARTESYDFGCSDTPNLV